jgi:hypothetical protein
LSTSTSANGSNIGSNAVELNGNVWNEAPILCKLLVDALIASRVDSDQAKTWLTECLGPLCEDLAEVD